jgi:cell division transport system ATP-binding protein
VGSIIQFKNIDLYQGKSLVLMNIDFTVDHGEFIYLIGKTGSGKSSLLKSLYGEIKINSGFAQFMDYNLSKLRRRHILALRRKIGIVFQDFQLLMDRNIEENLKFVLKATGWKKSSDIQNRISEVLIKVEMLDKKDKMPHQLSGGEQQRIAIARALLNNPEIILADEPTGNLDPETTMDIMKLLIEISNSGKTILMASHDYETIKKFPQRTLKCENQKLEEVNLMTAVEFI